MQSTFHRWSLASPDAIPCSLYDGKVLSKYGEIAQQVRQRKFAPLVFHRLQVWEAIDTVHPFRKVNMWQIRWSSSAKRYPPPVFASIVRKLPPCTDSPGQTCALGFALDGPGPAGILLVMKVRAAAADRPGFGRYNGGCHSDSESESETELGHERAAASQGEFFKRKENMPLFVLPSPYYCQQF